MKKLYISLLMLLAGCSAKVPTYAVDSNCIDTIIEINQDPSRAKQQGVGFTTIKVLAANNIPANEENAKALGDVCRENPKASFMEAGDLLREKQTLKKL